VPYLRSYVTGSNDAILGEVGRTTAVALVGVHHGPEGVSGHSFGTAPRGPTGQRQSRGRFSKTNRDWRLSSHKGQWRFYDRSLPRGSIMTLGVSLQSAWDECGRALVWG
jgi:hypothetical protein